MEASESVNEARQRSERQKQEKQKRLEELEATRRVASEKAKKMVKKLNATPFWEKWGDPIGYAAIGAVVVALLVINYTGDRRRPSDIPVNEDIYIQAHNEDKGHGYKLEKNAFFEGLNLGSVRDLFRHSLSDKKAYTKCDMSPLSGVSIPDSYNFYAEHANCRSTEAQKKCAAGYVELPVSVVKDRLCKAGQTEAFEPSVEYLLGCNAKANGCKGGSIMSTLAALRKGVIAKSCWDEKVGPSEPEKDKKDKKETCPAEKITECEKKGIDAYCHFEGVNHIKREIKQNGPVVSIMPPFRDFFVYKSGIFAPEDRGKVEGIVFVKIVGWELDADMRENWLVEPLWGQDWGQEGLARVKVGAEDSLIEQYAFALYPTLDAEKSEGQIRGKPEAYVEDD